MSATHSSLAGAIVAALGSLSLTGCLGSVDEQSPNMTATASSSSSLADWKPRVPLPRATLSPGEREQLNKKHLAWLASQLGLTDPPVIEPVRWIYPEEIGTVIVGCLKDAGFSVTSSSDGRGFSADAGTEAQLPLFRLAWYRCSALYPRDPRVDPGVWTQEQRAVAYEYISQALIPCLKSIGASPEPAPSLSVFVADQSSWRYPDAGNQKTMELWAGKCPPSPPSRAILGED